MKERKQFSVDEACKIRPFGPIAFRAGQTEILRIVIAAVLFGDDVFDVK
jgi:hypothetical protein